jgi:hypothetical protein
MRIYMLVLIVFISGCTRKNEYENIEVLTYSWTHGDYKNARDRFYITCSTYSSINEYGEAITYSDHSYFKDKPFYFTNKIEVNLIDSIISLVKRAEIDSIDKKIYDGPCIKIKINYTNQHPKIYTFPMVVRNEKFHPIRNLYHSFVNPTEIKLIGKQVILDRKRDILIANAMKLDTLSASLPKEK